VAELTVKNVSGLPVTIEHPDGTETVTFNDQEEKALTADYLLSKSFKEELAKGSFSFVTSAITKENAELARLVFPALLEELASPILSLHASMLKSKDALAKRRSQYNTAHEVALKLLTEAGSIARAPLYLGSGASYWLTPKPEQDAVDAALSAIEAHQKLNVPGDMTFQEWYEELERLQGAYKQAKVVLENTKAIYVEEFKMALEALTKAKDDFAAAATDPGIGSKIPSW